MAALCLFQFLYSCNNTDENFSISKNEASYQIIKGRVTFANAAQADKMFSELLRKSDAELNSWEIANNFKSLRSSNASDSVVFEIPSFLSTVLNFNSEYQIGDSIIWISNNNVYTIPSGDEELLLEIKIDPDNSKYSSYKNEFRSGLSQPSAEGSRILPSNMLHVTGSFRLYPAHEYRFARQLYVIYSGSRYWIELSTYMQYLHTRKRAWYGAGEDVDLREISQVAVQPDPGFSFRYELPGAYAENINGNLKVIVASSSQPFAGSVSALIINQVTGDQFHDLSQYETWE